MLNGFLNFIKRLIRLSRRNREIDPDEIFIDSRNLPNFDTNQFEGRLEKPISRKVLVFSGLAFGLIFSMLSVRAYDLQIKKGQDYKTLSDNNSLRSSIIIAPRGNIYDRNNVVLASNQISAEHPAFPSRTYLDVPGLGDLLGYVSYPKKDSAGNYYNTSISGKDGLESYFNDFLSGKNGSKIAETDVAGNIKSESVLEPPVYGGNLTLSIDSRIQSELYILMQNLADSIGFSGGAAVIMDVKTGELLAAVSYPEYKSSVMTEGKDAAAIQKYVTSPDQPFLDRAISGLYTPGSIVKPYLAVGALEEGVITPDKKILSTGSISIPNAYDPTKKSVFNDWRPQGWINMRDAIAVSSDVYFYEIGGGFEDQKGLGVDNIKKYMQLFGFGSSEPGSLLLPKSGTLPDPAWKAENFPGDPWRIGDTYNTAIGQYGVQVTPIQAVRAVASIANGGKLLEPTIITSDLSALGAAKNLGVNPANIRVVQEGMRQGVIMGTAANLNIPQVEVAAKTGTAELGTQKKYVNSWVTGFFPYDKPRYAFAAIMEKGPHDNTVGALYVMRQLFEWMGENTPEYLKSM